MRNNNPLNIRHGQSRWQGAAAVQTDSQFVKFSSMAYGYRAAWKILQTYHRSLPKEGKTFCLSNIIHRWAPPLDGNDTRAYLHRVIRYTGIAGMRPLSEPCSVGGFSSLQPVIVAMTCVECGIKPEEVPVSAILRGYQLAFPKVKFSELKIEN